MASTVPAKSQPLHNFSLPHLIWKSHRSGRNRLAGDTSSSSPPHRQSSPSNVSRRPSPLHKQPPIRHPESESEPSRLIINDKSTKSIDVNNRNNRSNKIRIRLPKNNDTVIEENHSSILPDDVVPSSAAGDEESLPKTWNLRPRRPPINHKQSNGSLPMVGSSPLLENNDRSNLMTSNKHKFSIALSRDEIEEDIYSLTGLKPSRRPKKRPRSVQKQLDTLFPGLWLGSITADSYKVSEPPLKG